MSRYRLLILVVFTLVAVFFAWWWYRPLSSLVGQDSDRNGIRDEVDTHIDENYAEKYVKQAVQQVARSYQRILSNPASTDDEGLLVATSCLQSMGVQLEVLEGIKAVSLNTAPRVRAYLKHDHQFSGTILKKDRRGREACDFDVSGAPEEE